MAAAYRVPCHAAVLGLLLICLLICVKKGYGRHAATSGHEPVMITDSDLPQPNQMPRKRGRLMPLWSRSLQPDALNASYVTQPQLAQQSCRCNFAQISAYFGIEILQYLYIWLTSISFVAVVLIVEPKIRTCTVLCHFRLAFK